MTDNNGSKGFCLCGRVTITAPSRNADVGACHCHMCRRWGGGPYMEVNCGTEVVFSGSENIALFNSSDWAERGFCKHCGTHLFYRLKGTGEHMVPVGVFEDDSGLQLANEVFIDEKPAYYRFANKTFQQTGAELFAQVAAAEEQD